MNVGEKLSPVMSHLFMLKHTLVLYLYFGSFRESAKAAGGHTSPQFPNFLFLDVFGGSV